MSTDRNGTAVRTTRPSPLDAAGAPTGPAASGAGPRRPHIAFVMEQHLGHRTYAENLRSAVEASDEVGSTWVSVDYTQTATWWERLPSEPVRSALRGRAEVNRGLRGTDADVHVFNTQVPAMLGGRAARRAPYVLCMDDTPRLMDTTMAVGYGHRPDRPWPTGWTKHHWNRRVLRRAAAYAPWSSWAARSLVTDYGVDPERIEVIPPGVDTRQWQPTVHDRDGPMRILFVGGDFDRKGGPHLLGAFAKLRPGSAELRIVTRSPVERLPGVRVWNDLSPNDPALVEIYRTSDVFVMPSRFEAFGIAAVEAAAAGLALIVSSVGGLGDLVQEGTTGFSVGADDREGLTRCLQLLADDPALRRRMGSAARRRAELEFDAGANAQRLMRLALRCIPPS